MAAPIDTRVITAVTEAATLGANDLFWVRPSAGGPMQAVKKSVITEGLATQSSVTTLDGLVVKKDGSVPMTGDLQMGGNTVAGLGAPSASDDAATKGYVDGAITGSPDGWNSFSGTPTWSYAAAQQMTVTVDYTSAIQKGDKLKLTQDATTKYPYVTAVAAGTVTLAGEVDLTVNAITDVKFSKIDSPQGFKNGLVYYHARAQGTTSTTLVDNTFSQIILDTEVNDPNSNFATNTYTVPVSGFYKVDFGSGIDIPNITTGGLDFFVSLFVNGIDRHRGSRISNTIAGLTNGEQISVGSVTVGLSKGATLELFGYLNAIDNVNRNTTAFSPYMMITFLHI